VHSSHLHFEQQIQEQRQQERRQPSPTQLPQLQQGPQQRDTISIVSGGASKTTDAFQQNPAEVSVGATATWTSDDSQPHTVTSGQTPPTPNGGFDSCILAPAARFEHTFTDAGEYLYFLVLYPNMVGSVGIR
jgi:plastocyanin